MIKNIKIGMTGTVCFDGKFKGMRKSQDFVTYPMKDYDGKAKIQSDTRFGFIDLKTGEVSMSKPRANYANYVWYQMSDKVISQLTEEELEAFKAFIFDSAGPMAGNNGLMFCDNSGAYKVS